MFYSDFTNNNILTYQLTLIEREFYAVETLIGIVENDIELKKSELEKKNYDGGWQFEYYDIVDLQQFHYKSLIIALYSLFESSLLQLCESLELYSKRELKRNGNLKISNYLGFLKNYKFIKHKDIVELENIMNSNRLIRNAICHTNSKLYDVPMYILDNKDTYDNLGLLFYTEETYILVHIKSIEYPKYIYEKLLEFVRILSNSFPKNISDL
ncbi:hypothetical protein [Siphonobacter curvatus]|uniref:Uncharacterized protein n=1 Tax=Siphonobacter curvatus TaxID=2094562 RepID=A0A2S7IR00_9BACT|nr:hypothetical protein [Siphonobacter curvatus]PQA60147.1 hypothetical protein C5O19_11170 [Siphonobacter curvatus]